MVKRTFPARELSISLLSLLAGISALLGGLYGPLERYALMAGVFAVCVAWLALAQRKKLAVSWATPCALLLVVGYAAGLVTPASTLGAINGLIVVAGAMTSFITWSSFAPTDSEREHLSAVLLGSSFIIAAWGAAKLLGLVGSTGTITRLEVGFGYPNATAAWLAMGTIMAVVLSFHPSSKLSGTLSYTAGTLVVAALVWTGSRGGWLATAIVLVVAVLTSGRKALAFLLHAGSIGVLGIGLGVALQRAPDERLLAVALLGAAIVGWAATASRRFRWLPYLVSLLPVLVGVAYVSHSLGRENIYTLQNRSSEPLWQVITLHVDRPSYRGEIRLQGKMTALNPGNTPFAGHLSVAAFAAGERLQSLHNQSIVSGEHLLDIAIAWPEKADALRLTLANLHPNTQITLSSPVLRLVSQEQSVQISDPLHRLLPAPLVARIRSLHWETLLEDGRARFARDALVALQQAPLFGRGGGTWGAVYPAVQSTLYGSSFAHSDLLEFALDIGVLGLVVYLVLLAVAVLPPVLTNTSNAGKACALAALVVIVQSAGEALLAFPSLYLAAFALLGAAQGQTHRLKVARPVALVMVAFFGSIAILSGSLALGEAAARQGEGRQALSLALRFNPWQAERRVQLAEVLALPDERAPEVTRLYQSAQRLEPFSAQFTSQLGQHYLRIGNLFSATAVLKQAILLQPMNIVHYENAAFAAAHTATALTVSSPLEARDYASQTLAIYERFSSVLAKADDEWKRANPAFRLTPRLAVDVGRALAILGERDRAWPYLLRAADEPGGVLFGAANPWLQELYGYSFQLTAPRNLLSTALSHVASAQGYWAHRVTLAHDTDIGRHGNGSLKVTATASGGHGIGVATATRVQAGQTYTASVYLRQLPARPVYLRIDWFTDSGRNGFTFGQASVVGQGWQRLSTTGEAPPGTTLLRLFVLTHNSAASGDTLWVDAWMVERGVNATRWVPGQTR